MKKVKFQDKPIAGLDSVYIFLNDEDNQIIESNGLPDRLDKFESKDLYTSNTSDSLNEIIFDFVVGCLIVQLGKVIMGQLHLIHQVLFIQLLIEDINPILLNQCLLGCFLIGDMVLLEREKIQVQVQCLKMWN